MKRLAASLFSWMTALVVVLAARTAAAHSIGISRGEYRAAGATVSVEITLSQRELVLFMPEIDQDHDGFLDAPELAAGAALIGKTFVEGVTIAADGDACKGAFDGARLIDDDDGVDVRAHYTCRWPPGQLTIAWPILTAMPAGHRHIAKSTGGLAAQTTVAYRGSGPWTIDLSSPVSRAGATAWALFKLGIEHILTGTDHLVFLLGLILVGTTLRSLAVVVSAFTLAHSITLALATLSVFVPSPRWVEPLIALSIAYVGVENFFVKDVSKRWRITFPFGLIHGFGFAGALREIALPRSQVPIALVSFNLGVEAGQLAALAVALPIVLAVRRIPHFPERGVMIANAGIALAGLAWFVVRISAAS